MKDQKSNHNLWYPKEHLYKVSYICYFKVIAEEKNYENLLRDDKRQVMANDIFILKIWFEYM